MTSAAPADQGRLPLTRERILQAALELIDVAGVEGLTMRRLGAALGVEAMSLYNHVPNKAALLDGIVETVVSEIDIPPREADWTERLRHLGRSFREAALRHPQIVPLLAKRPLRATPALEPVEVIFEALAEAGAEPREAADAYRAMADFALGFTMTEAADVLDEGGDAASAFTDLTPEDLGKYPHLMAVAPFLLNPDAAAQFEYGLDVVITGVKNKIER